MATVKTILYTRYKSKDGTYPIIIRLIDRTKQKLHPVGYKVKDSQFKNGQVIKHEDAAIINSVIDVELGKAKRYIADCKIKGIAPDITLAFSSVNSHSFSEYLKKRAANYKAKGQVIMFQKCERFVKELGAYYGGEVFFTDITIDKLRGLEAYLKDLPNSANTIAKKYDFLSRFYGNALAEGLVTGENPFKKYKVKTEPVKKEKLTVKELEALRDIPLKVGAAALARDLFLFAYYCKGIRFETVITMPKTALNNDRLHFRTNKGKKHLSVRVHSKLRTIIDKYIDNESEYLFPVLHTPYEELKRNPFIYKKAIDVANTTTNRNLRIAVKLAGIKKQITFHNSRHTLAYHMKGVTNSILAITDILGQSKSEITERYLKELDDEFLDAELEKLYGK